MLGATGKTQREQNGVQKRQRLEEFRSDNKGLDKQEFSGMVFSLPSDSPSSKPPFAMKTNQNHLIKQNNGRESIRWGQSGLPVHIFWMLLSSHWALL